MRYKWAVNKSIIKHNYKAIIVNRYIMVYKLIANPFYDVFFYAFFQIFLKQLVMLDQINKLLYSPLVFLSFLLSFFFSCSGSFLS